MTVCFAIIFAVLNRGRGCHFWGLFASTQLSRIVATGLMAFLLTATAGELAVLSTWPLLMAWAMPGWGVYQSAATGNPTNFMEHEFLPVDWLMKRLACFDGVYAATATDFWRRLWGTVAMGMRQALAAPTIVLAAYLTGQSAWYAVAPPLLALPYLGAGYLVKTGHVMWAEYASGAMLGLILLGAIRG